LSIKTGILIADDDANLRETLRCALEREEFRVVAASEGLAALSRMRADPAIALAVLDVSMPRMDGFELLKELRRSGDARPVIILTSRDEEFDRVLGLELGADDYLTKPFSIRELAARIKAVLRRASGGAGKEARTLRAGGLFLDEESFRAAWEGRDIRLTITEFRILASLAARPGTVRTREALIEAAFPDDGYQSDRAVDCHIKRLRKKIAVNGAPEGAIETVYGLGYRFNP
jgi:DNA-binding response OmpR family regulator